MITLTARFTMRAGRIALALRRVAAVKVASDREQPGTLLYLVHRELDARKRPTRALLFYECYRDAKALQAHLASASWQTLTSRWGECFEGTTKDIQVTSLERIAGFVHLDAP